MSGLNFSNFKVVDSSNTKQGGFGGRSALDYNFRYSRYMSKKEVNGVKEPHEDFFFELSEKLFKSLGLDGLKGLVQIVSPEGVSYLAVVDNDHAVLLKTTKKNEGGEKGRKFKSTIIEAALEAQGVISTKIVGEPQYLDLVLVEGSQGAVLGGKITADGVYEVVKGEAKEAPKAEAAPETNDTTPEVEGTSPDAAQNVAAPEPEVATTSQPEVAAGPGPVIPSADDDF